MKHQKKALQAKKSAFCDIVKGTIDSLTCSTGQEKTTRSRALAALHTGKYKSAIRHLGVLANLKGLRDTRAAAASLEYQANQLELEAVNLQETTGFAE